MVFFFGNLRFDVILDVSQAEGLVIVGDSSRVPAECRQVCCVLFTVCDSAVKNRAHRTSSLMVA